MSSNIHTEASLSTRARVWLASSPLVTRYLTLAMAGILAGDLALRAAGADTLAAVCMSPRQVAQHWQLHRFLTSALWHTGPVHLALNLLALAPIGASLERSLGSVAFLALVALLGVAGDCLYVTVAYAAAILPLRLTRALLDQCAVGFSGVLFGLIVVDTQLSSAAARSIFGVFSVPAQLYPWALLFLWQFLLPRASFLGHLSGLLAGLAYVRGYLKRVTPSGALIQRLEGLEGLPPFTMCYSRAGFIAYTGGSGGLLPLSQPASDGSGAVGTAVSGWLRGLWRPFPTGLQIQMNALTQRPAPTAAPAEESLGVRLGGADAGSEAETHLEPKTAAAAAAEARMARSGGGRK